MVTATVLGVAAERNDNVPNRSTRRRNLLRLLRRQQHDPYRVRLKAVHAVLEGSAAAVAAKDRARSKMCYWRTAFHGRPAGRDRPIDHSNPDPMEYPTMPMRIQSRHKRDKYGDGLEDLDPYFTPPEAIRSLIVLEGDRLPRRL